MDTENNALHQYVLSVNNQIDVYEDTIQKLGKKVSEVSLENRYLRKELERMEEIEYAFQLEKVVFWLSTRKEPTGCAVWPLSSAGG